jgi:hypothetical protein
MKMYEALFLIIAFCMAMPLWHRLVKALVFNVLVFFVRPGFPVTIVTPKGKEVVLKLPTIDDVLEFKEDPFGYLKSHNIDWKAL